MPARGRPKPNSDQPIQSTSRGKEEESAFRIVRGIFYLEYDNEP